MYPLSIKIKKGVKRHVRTSEETVFSSLNLLSSEGLVHNDFGFRSCSYIKKDKTSVTHCRLMIFDHSKTFSKVLS